jgi:hypothetical protein
MNNKRAWFRQATAAATLWAFLLTGAPPAAAAARRAQASPNAQSAPRPESSLKIDHNEVPCVTTEVAPEVDAAVAPAQQFEKGYVYFRAAGTEDFYYAPMKGQPDSLAGMLPRPLPETKAIDYNIKATDVTDLSRKTQDYSPPVVPGNACKVKGPVVGADGAGLTLGLTKEGQNPVPPGFNKKDIKYVILFSGSVVALAAAVKAAGAAGGGGGVSTGVLVAAGAVVGAGVGIGIAASGSKKAATPVPSATPTPTPTTAPTATPTAIPFHFIVADATWSGEGDVDVRIIDATGNSQGTVIPAGCESVLQRTERVLLQGAVPNGTYRVTLQAKSCSVSTPAQIAVLLSVVSDSVPKCPGTFVNVPTGGAAQVACTFTVP